MKRSWFDTLLSFMLGFAWGLLFLGSWFVYKIVSVFGFPLAFFSTMLFIFFTLFAIVMLEGLNTYKEHTRLLRQIRDLLSK